MNRLIIHNFYDRKNPSGENDVVRLRSRASKARLFFFSEAGKLRFSTFLLKRLLRPKATEKRIRAVVNDQNIGAVEVHNTHPSISLKTIASIAKQYRVDLFLHNFRYVAPCAVLMTKEGKYCDRCIKSKKFVYLTPFLRCYDGSFIKTLFNAWRVLNIDKRGLFKNIAVIHTFSDFHFGAHSSLLGENVELIKTVNEVRLNPILMKNTKSGVIYIGRLSKEKGIREMLQFWSGAADLPRLTIYGSGPLEMEVRSASQQWSNIVFGGYLDAAGKATVYSSAAAILIPSICAEGYPMVLAEAKSCGVPVLYNEVPPLSEHLVDHPAYSFNWGSTSEREMVGLYRLCLAWFENV